LSGSTRLYPVYYHLFLVVSFTAIVLFGFIWLPAHLGWDSPLPESVNIALAVILVAMVPWEMVFFRDVLRSPYTGTKASVDGIIVELETTLEGRSLRRRHPGPVRPLKVRWTEVLDLGGGLVMHLRDTKYGAQVFVGPLTRENREEVRNLLDLVNRIGSDEGTGEGS